MKKLCLTLLCITLLLANAYKAHSQVALVILIFGDKVASEELHLNLDAGLSFTSLPGVPGAVTKLNPYFGMGIAIKLNNKWSLVPEFKPLSPKGAKGISGIKDYSTTIAGIDNNIIVNYIDVPLLVQYRATKRLFFSAGPQINFMTSARQISEGKLKTTDEEIKVVQEVESTFKRHYYQFPLELGYSISLKKNSMGMDIKFRYNIGLSEMIADPNYGSSKGSSFMVFLSFPFINEIPAEAK
jgi:hypothetical protein